MQQTGPLSGTGADPQSFRRGDEKQLLQVVLELFDEDAAFAPENGFRRHHEGDHCRRIFPQLSGKLADGDAAGFIDHLLV